MAQLVEFDNLWNGTEFHCPACGAEIYTADGEPTSSPCPHLMFSWLDAVGEYDNPSSDIKSLLKQLSDADDYGYEPCPHDDELLDALPDDAVLFALTQHGMACGPVSSTIIHAVRFPYREL